MMRSLYSRVVLSFLAAVIVGLVAAFFSTTYWFRGLVTEEVSEDMLLRAKDIANTYHLTQGLELAGFIDSRYTSRGYSAFLLNAAGELLNKPTLPPKAERLITPDILKSVLDGHIYNGHDEAPERLMIGYPIQANGQTYALFMRPAIEKTANDIRNIILTSLVITLIVGSVFIVIAARYLVRPLKLMTQATKRMARGDFDFELEWGKPRKDELGDLAVSFTHMATELKQIEQMRQDFVSNVSHEIQSPLTSIAGFSNVLRKKDVSEEEKRHYLDIIQTETERLSRLSSNLLRLASLDSEHHPFHARTYALDEQLRRVILSLEPQWSAKDLELELELPAVKLSADEDLLNQVWMNLISNSIKYTPDGGKISVRLQAFTDRVSVAVADTGIGIAADDLGHIFERFFKADRSRERAHGGNGLGLAIVRRIVDLHRGDITVRSEPGRGAEFVVRLPSVR